ncbi:MAG: EAL domain-containing protein, partial [Methylococcales bacterium]
LRGELYLNLDKYFNEESPGRFTAGYLGLKLDSVFQPVVDSRTHRAIGFEALLRPTVGGLASIPPQMAFRYVESNGKLVKFDRICRTLHLLNSLSLPAQSGLLFLNVLPELLARVDSHGRVFEQILKQHAVPTHKVVIEIPDTTQINEAILKKAMNNYRDCGYQVAINNFGRRGSDLGRLWRLSADFIKSDVGLVRDLAAHQKLQHIFAKLVEIIRDSGAEAIIQGIETEQQRSFALTAGARLMQGSLFGQFSGEAKAHIVTDDKKWTEQAR